MDNINIDNIEIKGENDVVITTPISAVDFINSQQAIIDDATNDTNKRQGYIAQRLEDNASDTNIINNNQVIINDAQAKIDKVRPALPVDPTPVVDTTTPDITPLTDTTVASN